MIKSFKSLFVLLSFVLMAFSCSKDEEQPEVYIVPVAEQYPKDLANIEKYFDEYSMQVSNDGNYDVTFTKIPTPNPGGLQPIRTEFASNLHFKMVKNNGVDYKVYYLSLNEGTDKSITRVDSAFVSYRGEYLYTKKEEVVPATNPVTYNTFLAGKQFDQAQNPVWFPLDNVIQGWKEILPFFKTGVSSGVNVFSDFGAGVMFLPSGLGYYTGASGIPPYSPLIFTFKLKAANHIDHDLDRIDSKDEDINGNGIFTDDDTDGDGIQNYYDKDDDGDGYTTKNEIRKPTPLLANQGPSAYYPYNPFTVVDDPATTTVDESLNSEPKGIPDISGDGTTSTRTRRHLNKNAKPPYTVY